MMNPTPSSHFDRVVSILTKWFFYANFRPGSLGKEHSPARKMSQADQNFCLHGAKQTQTFEEMKLRIKKMLRDVGTTALITIISVIIVAGCAFGMRTIERLLEPTVAYGATIETEAIQEPDDGSFVVVAEGGRPYDKPPMIRIGIYEVEPNVKVKVYAPRDYGIFKQDGTLVRVVPAYKWTDMWVGRDGLYRIKQSNWWKAKKEPYYVQQLSHRYVLKMPSYENRPAWDTSINDNVFRGRMEMGVAEDGGIWAVNELRLDFYLKGVAETSNTQPFEYLKAMAVAERTYALYNVENPTKYPDEPYTLTATANDQIYRGYNYEKRSPNVVRAVDGTRGRVLAYNGNVEVTPYFSRSDGRTRSWSEVWNGERPWLVSVPDPYCEGMALSGHGVGMSAEGARQMAINGAGWKTILRHYFTDMTEPGYWY